MKKAGIIISSIIVLIIVVLVGLFIWKGYAESHKESESVKSYAKLNPLIKHENYYVKVNDPVKKNSEDSAFPYKYKTKGSNKNGKVKTITFNGRKKLKKDHYLKIDTFLDSTNGYEEVKKSKIPNKAIEKIK